MHAVKTTTIVARLQVPLDCREYNRAAITTRRQRRRAREDPDPPPY